MKKLLISFAALLVSVSAFALTPAELGTLKSTAQADPTASVYLQNGNDNELAAWFNDETTTIVWRSVLTPELSRAAIVDGAIQLDNLTVGKRDALLYLVSGDLDVRNEAVRSAIENICGSQNTLKGALQASWRRTANRAEAALATGTGTSGDPATMTFEGNISQYDVSMIRSVP